MRAITTITEWLCGLGILVCATLLLFMEPVSAQVARGKTPGIFSAAIVGYNFEQHLHIRAIYPGQHDGPNYGDYDIKVLVGDFVSFYDSDQCMFIKTDDPTEARNEIICDVTGANFTPGACYKLRILTDARVPGRFRTSDSMSVCYFR